MSGALYVAWPENGSLSQAMVLDHVVYDGGRPVLDANGQIHVLLNSLADSRYLKLGTGVDGSLSVQHLQVPVDVLL